MKNLTKDILRDLRLSHSGCNTIKFKWDRLYESEDELIHDMFHEKVLVDGPYYKLCKGYEYIKSFRKYYEKHKCLTEKQMIQLKRLSAEIAYRIYSDNN